MSTFANADSEKMNQKLALALSNAREVIDALEGAKEFAADFGDLGSIGHFQSEVEELISNDGGSAGLEAWIRVRTS